MAIVLAIPTLTRFDLLAKCIASARRGTLAPDRVIVVDNSAGDCPPMDGVVVIPGRQPQSVAKAWNDAVRLVGDDLILSNDDITFAPSTIEAMVATARSRPQAGMVSPIEGERFALFYLRYAAWLSMDGFSEDYIAAYFEDDHAARMLRLRGWELAIAPSDVGHVGSATISAYNRARKEQHHRDFRANRALYYLTWGGLPGEEVYDEPRKRKA